MTGWGAGHELDTRHSVLPRQRVARTRPEVSSCAFEVSASAAFMVSQKVRVVAPPKRVTFFSQESVYKLVMQNKNAFFYWKILSPAIKFPDKPADGYVTMQT